MAELYYNNGDGTYSKFTPDMVGAAAASHKHDAGDITTGTLPASRGGTGNTTLNASANAMINSLTTGVDTPTDGDYIITQYVGGGTTTTTYHRRKMSALWEYIKSKLDAYSGFNWNEV